MLNRVYTIIFSICIIAFVTGCFLNRDAATAYMHASDNRLAAEQERQNARILTEQARQDAKTEVARLNAMAETNKAAERTQQTLLVQNASAERLHAQSMYLTARMQENTTRMIFVLSFFAVLGIIGGAVFVWIYLRNNPPATPWGYLPVAQPQQLPAVPSWLIKSDPRFIEAGWQVVHCDGRQIGQRVKPDGTVQQCSLILEDKQL